MSHIVVYTQDLPGEREWLRTKFPNFTFLQTKSANLWENKVENGLYEIAYQDHDDSQPPVEISNRVKSVYTLTKEFDLGWTDSDQLVTDIQFSEFRNLPNRYYRAITFGRCGTVFLESLLRVHRFEQLSHHDLSNDPYVIHLIINDLRSKPVTLFFTYRDNWWEWLVSEHIAQAIGNYVHHNTVDEIDWSTALIPKITRERIAKLIQDAISKWNLWCEIRTRLPQHDMYLLEMKDYLRTFSDYTSHLKIPYNKRSLVVNYDEAKQIFDTEFKEMIELSTARARNHLIQMGAKTVLTKELLGIK